MTKAAVESATTTGRGPSALPGPAVRAHHGAEFAGPAAKPLMAATRQRRSGPGWLTATALLVSVLPLSIVVEVAGSREMIQRLMGGYELPYLVLRFAAADPHTGGIPRTHGCRPRRPSRLSSKPKPCRPSGGAGRDQRRERRVSRAD